MNFTRPGTAYGGFYKNQSQKIKPYEEIQKKNVSSKSQMQYLWFDRVNKILQQVDYMQNLVDFLDFVAQKAHTIQNDFLE